MTKEQVFQIMGKYYGNYYYRSAVEQGIGEQDLRVVTGLLDAVNALGYHFSNTHRLEETEDKRLVPLILDSFEKIQAVNYREELLSAIRYQSYAEFVPRLLEIYETSSVQAIRVAASEALMSIRSRKYKSEYVRIVNSATYGAEHDWMLELLCKLREPAVLPKLTELTQYAPKVWGYTFLKYAASFKDPEVIPTVARFLDSDDGQIRRMAKKALEKLQKQGENMV